MRLNLARTLRRSSVNGPGERFVVWVQGCTLACPGCWNPDTWSFARRDVRTVDALVNDILDVEDIEGVTFTGGEPFAQAQAVAKVAERVRSEGLSVVVFTGYELHELSGDDARELLARTDVLVAGRYREEERCEGQALIGSSNQKLHFLSDRYGPDDVCAGPEAEIHIGPGGAIALTGFPRFGLAELLSNVHRCGGS